MCQSVEYVDSATKSAKAGRMSQNVGTYDELIHFSANVNACNVWPVKILEDLRQKFDYTVTLLRAVLRFPSDILPVDGAQSSGVHR